MEELVTIVGGKVKNHDTHRRYVEVFNSDREVVLATTLGPQQEMQIPRGVGPFSIHRHYRPAGEDTTFTASGTLPLGDA